MSDASPAMSACQDCGQPVSPPPNGGHTPRRCPLHAAEHKRQLRAEHKRITRARSRRDSCVGCGAPLPELRSKGIPRKWFSEACRVRAARTPAAGDLEASYLRTLRRDPCVYCSEPSTVLDHIEPRAHGGEDHWRNLAAACERCNQRKAARPLLRFLLAAPLLTQIDEAKAELAAIGG